MKVCNKVSLLRTKLILSFIALNFLAQPGFSEESSQKSSASETTFNPVVKIETPYKIQHIQHVNAEMVQIVFGDGTMSSPFPKRRLKLFKQQLAKNNFVALLLSGTGYGVSALILFKAWSYEDSTNRFFGTVFSFLAAFSATVYTGISTIPISEDNHAMDRIIRALETSDPDTCETVKTGFSFNKNGRLKQ